MRRIRAYAGEQIGSAEFLIHHNETSLPPLGPMLPNIDRLLAWRDDQSG